VCEWAYQHDDERAALALELTEPDTPEPTTRPPTPAQRPPVWLPVWAATGCADCAGAAVEGRPFGPDHCWATHRPHTPIADTNDDRGER